MKKILFFIIILILVITLYYIIQPEEQIKLAGKMHYRGEYKNDTSTLLDNGKVLIVGGGCGEPKAEIYDPTTDTFSIVGKPHSTLYFHKAILLKNGNVLVVSSQGVEIFDIKSEKFRLIKDTPLFKPILPEPNKAMTHITIKDKKTGQIKKIPLKHPLKLQPYVNFYSIMDEFLILQNGDIFVLNTNPYKWQDYSIQIYEPVKIQKKWAIKVPYKLSSPELLSDGNILMTVSKFIDRTNYKNGYYVNNFQEIGKGLYNPSNNTFKLVNNYKKTAEQIKKEEIYKKAISAVNKKMKSNKGYQHEPVILKSGKVLFLGENRNYIYDPLVNKLHRINDFHRWRRDFATTVLNNSNVLITGGSCGNQESHSPYDEAELFIEK